MYTSDFSVLVKETTRCLDVEAHPFAGYLNNHQPNPLPPDCTIFQVDAKIAELPGGTLFPDDLAKRLIKMYDQNGDGVLQQSEFAPTEELRARLESIFRERREEELEARKIEREREMDNKRRVCERVPCVFYVLWSWRPE